MKTLPTPDALTDCCNAHCVQVQHQLSPVCSKCGETIGGFVMVFRDEEVIHRELPHGTVVPFFGGVVREIAGKDVRITEKYYDFTMKFLHKITKNYCTLHEKA